MENDLYIIYNKLCRCEFGFFCVFSLLVLWLVSGAFLRFFFRMGVYNVISSVECRKKN